MEKKRCCLCRIEMTGEDDICQTCFNRLMILASCGVLSVTLNDIEESVFWQSRYIPIIIRDTFPFVMERVEILEKV